MMTKVTNSGSSKRRLLLLTCGLVAAGVVGGAAAGIAVAQEPPGPDDYNVRVLAAASGPDLPSQLVEADSSLQKDSLRSLATHEGTQYWVGLDGENNVCLVALFGTKDWVTGQSCTDPKQFELHGAGLRLYGPEGLVEAYLVPDGVDADANTTKVTSNLRVIDPYTPAAERAEVNKAAESRSGNFALSLFDAPFTLEDPK